MGASRSEITVDTAAGEMAEVVLVAVAGVRRNLLGIGVQHSADIGEQPWQGAGVCRARLQALGDNDLMRAIDRDLGVVASDHRPGTQRLDATIGIGEIALGAIGRTTVRTPLRFAALHHARGGARSILIVGRRLFGFGLERRFGGAAALLATESRISSPRRSPPWVRSSSASVASAWVNQSETSAGEPLLGLLHAAIRHRLVHARVGSNLGAVQCHMPEPHQPRRPAQLQHLNEQIAQGLQVALRTRTDGRGRG